MNRNMAYFVRRTLCPSMNPSSSWAVKRRVTLPYVIQKKQQQTKARYHCDMRTKTKHVISMHRDDALFCASSEMPARILWKSAHWWSPVWSHVCLSVLIAYATRSASYILFFQNGGENRHLLVLLRKERKNTQRDTPARWHSSARPPMYRTFDGTWHACFTLLRCAEVNPLSKECFWVAHMHVIWLRAAFRHWYW